MSPRTCPDEREIDRPPWSPETETREEVKALLLRRTRLHPSEVVIFHTLFSDIYDTWVETLCCVVRSRGAPEASELDLVHDALTTFLDETIAQGFPASIQAKLLAHALGFASNHVRREGRNPATEMLPTSSKEAPGSFPRLDRELDLKEVVRVLLERLSPEHQRIIDAVVLRDLTVGAAGKELGLHRTTAQSRLTAAMTLLREWTDELLSASERRL